MGSTGQAIASVSFSLETAGVSLTSLLVSVCVCVVGGDLSSHHTTTTTKTLALNMTSKLVISTRTGIAINEVKEGKKKRTKAIKEITLSQKIRVMLVVRFTTRTIPEIG